MKNKRLITNRTYPDAKSYDCIEIDEHGTFFWTAIDEGEALNKNTGEVMLNVFDPVSCSFPVDLDFVSDFFKKMDRELDLSLLPSNYNANPYGVNL